MQFEHITAPPPEQSPQLRYSALHRTIRKGIASDRTYSELAEVCLELNLHDEAMTAQSKVCCGSERVHLQNKMVREGLLERPEFRPRGVQKSEHSGLFSEVGEAFRFLADDQMPVVLVVATVTFPVIMGLGGYVAQLRPDLIPLSAVVVSAALVLAVLLAVCRRVLVESADGIEDAPPMPGLITLGRESVRLAVETAVVATILLGPAVASLQYGLPWYGAIASLAIGVYLMPLAMGLMMTDYGLKALSPHILLPAACRGGMRYAGVLVAFVLLMTPAVGCWLVASDTLPLLRIAFVGPLVVAPMVMAFRLLGRFLHGSRRQAEPGQQCAASRSSGLRQRAPQPRSAGDRGSLKPVFGHSEPAPVSGRHQRRISPLGAS